MIIDLIITSLKGVVCKRLLVSFLLGIFGLSSGVYAFTPTPQQVSAFKNMPLSEQKKLAEQFGVDLEGIGGKDDRASPIAFEEIEPREVEFEGGDGGTESDDVTEDAEDGLVRDTHSEPAVDEINSEVEVLRPYGYELFAGEPTTFVPTIDVPVTSDYIVGPGDTVITQFYGKQNITYELSVSRDGILSFPDIGPVSASGMTFNELKDHIKKTVSQQLIGVKASVTMGLLRSIRVFILGEAYRPGAYTVSAMSTITNALIASGGINQVGSLRNVQLKRKGEVIGRFDLYDLLLRGDTSDDKRLLPGDVIFVPPIGKTASINGEVKRPAIYELKGGETAAELVELAGGFLPTAYPSATRIERINKKGNRVVVDVNLSTDSGRGVAIRDADYLQVHSVLDTVERVVQLHGHVKRPGNFQFKEGLRVSDVIPNAYALLPNADLHYVLITREQQPSRKIQVLKVDLSSVFKRKGGPSDVRLRARDTLFVFDLNDSREEYLALINETLELQANVGSYPKLAQVFGNVHLPGTYPVHKDMTYKDLISASGSIKPETDIKNCLVIRQDPRHGGFSVDVLSLASDRVQEKVNAYDQLYVFGFQDDRAEILTPIIEMMESNARKNRELHVVQVTGYVKSPGEYPLAKGASVRDLIALSGGFEEQAFALSAEITRYVMNEKSHQVTQRIFVDLSTNGDVDKVKLMPKDHLYIKRTPNWNERETVDIEGEVNFPGTYPIYKGDTISALLERAGGLTEYAEPSAAVFLREALRMREQKQLEFFRNRLERDVASIATSSDGAVGEKKEAESLGNVLIDQLASTEALGRLVIDLPKILASKERDIELKSEDKLIIPSKNPEVSVLGEVQFPTSHIFDNAQDVFDYIEVSGGYSSRADDSRIYVIRANGEVAAVKNGWFFKKNTEIGPGDSIVVPYDVYSVSPMTYWSGVSQILFQLATTVAALNTVGVF